jgi:repressor LexA
VLRAIERYFRRHDRAPTVRDICHETGITSTSYVYYLLAGLELAGYITRDSGVSRGIRLTRPRGVPIKGSIAAGQPLDLFEEVEFALLDLAAHTRHEGEGEGEDADCEFAFRVRGDSMVEDGIFDGDYVFVRPGHEAPPGATVVAVHLVHEASELGAATLKRFQPEPRRNRVVLCPANAAMPPIVVPMQVWKREWAIQGTVTAIYRQYGV